jgi:hypothetical protein
VSKSVKEYKTFIPKYIHRMSISDLYNFRSLLWNRQDNTCELSDIRLQLSKSELKCTHAVSMIYHQGQCSRKWWYLCKKRSVSSGLIKPNVWNECNGTNRQNLEWIHLLRSPFMHFTNSCEVRFAAKCMAGTYSHQ